MCHDLKDTPDDLVSPQDTTQMCMVALEVRP